MDWTRHAPRSPLAVPDAHDWRREQDYSPTVAEALLRAYPQLSDVGRPAEDQRVYARLHALRDRSMADHQRLLLHYALAWAAAQEGASRSALDDLDAALEVAEQLGDRSASLELAWRAGVLSHLLGHYLDARDYCSEALETLRALSTGTEPVDARLELDLLLRLAAVDFELASFGAVTQRLDEATLLLPLVSDTHLDIASIEWIQAVQCRWQGQLGLALERAMRATEDLERMAPPAARFRIQLVVADIALDLAGRFARGSLAYTTHVAQAQRYVDSAGRLAQEVGDPIGDGMARLVLQRRHRAGGRNIDGIALIEAVARSAQGLGDMGLLGRAWLALGDEHTAQGESESALVCYRQACDILERHHLKALAILPRRSLLRASEWSTQPSVWHERGPFWPGDSQAMGG